MAAAASFPSRPKGPVMGGPQGSGRPHPRRTFWEAPCAGLGGWASEVQRLPGGMGLGAASFGESLILPGRALPSRPAGVRQIFTRSGAGPGARVDTGVVGGV